MKRLFPVILAAVPLPATALSEGLVYTQESRRVHRDALGRERSETLRQKLFVKGPKLRSETSGTNLVSIIRLDKDLIYQMDLGRGIYSEIRLSDMLKAVETYKDGLRAVFNRMSAEKRRRLAAVLGKARPRVKVVRSSTETEISGIPCRKYSFYENGLLRLEMWITFRFRPAADYSRLLEVNGEFSRALISERRRIGGFALKQRIHPLLEINPSVENTVLSIETRPLPDELFELPGGLKKVPPSLIKPTPEENPSETSSERTIHPAASARE